MTGAAGGMEIRVTVGDTWMPRSMAVNSGDTVAAVKRRALELDNIDPARADRYEVKVSGGLIRDESHTLASAGVTAGTPVIVLARRRRPVR